MSTRLSDCNVLASLQPALHSSMIPCGTDGVALAATIGPRTMHTVRTVMEFAILRA